MYECPDHPDIVAIQRTGYPSWFDTGQREEPDEDRIYESRRDEDLLGT